MAKKGQKFRIYSDEERTEIVNKYLSGNYSYELLAREYGMSKKSVETMVRKYKKTGLTVLVQRGRPKTNDDLTREDYKERYEILKKYQTFLKAQRERK